MGSLTVIPGVEPSQMGLVPSYLSSVLKLGVWVLQLWGGVFVLICFLLCLFLEFHINFRIKFSILEKKAMGIFVGIALNLYISLRNIAVLSILLHEYGIFFIYLDLLSFLSAMFCSFHCVKSSTAFVKAVSKCLICSDAVAYEIIYFTSLLGCSLLAYKHDFPMLILYPVILRNLFIIFNHFFVDC